MLQAVSCQHSSCIGGLLTQDLNSLGKNTQIKLRVTLTSEQHGLFQAIQFSSALQSDQRALDIRVELFREEHPDTAQSYFNLGLTHHVLGNFSSALQSRQRALDIRVKLFREEKLDTAIHDVKGEVSFIYANTSLDTNRNFESCL